MSSSKTEKETQKEGSAPALASASASASAPQVPNTGAPQVPNTIIKVSKFKILSDLSEVDQSWSIARISKEAYPSSWAPVFNPLSEEFDACGKIIEDDEKENGRIVPLRRNIYKAFELTALKDVKVIIIGQDPYHQIGEDGFPRAQGFSFSVSKQDVIPVSLRNIFKELTTDLPDFKAPNHGCLEGWAKQGVLLLNASLTTREGQANAHKGVWEFFISKTLTEIGKQGKPCVVMLWGAEARKVMNKLKFSNYHILESAHPSGFSASKFYGCKHFSKCNKHLISKGEKAINWGDL